MNSTPYLKSPIGGSAQGIARYPNIFLPFLLDIEVPLISPDGALTIGTSIEFLEGNILPDKRPRQYKVMAVTKKYNKKLPFDICILVTFFSSLVQVWQSKDCMHDCFSAASLTQRAPRCVHKSDSASGPSLKITKPR